MALRGKKPAPKTAPPSNVVAFDTTKPARRGTKKAAVAAKPETIADCCPNKVFSNAVAKSYWDFYVKRVPHLRPEDANLLGDLACQLAYIDDIDDELADMTVQGAPMSARAALMGCRGQRSQEMRRFLAELGISPTMRDRLGDSSSEGSAIDPTKKYF